MQDRKLPGIAKINTNSVHVDVRASGKYWGDESCGKSGITDFYTYFGVPKPTSKPIPKPTLQAGPNDTVGSQGEEVKKLQKILVEVKKDIDVDGKYGKETKTSLKTWQDKYDCSPVDGIYGPITEKRMHEVY